MKRSVCGLELYSEGDQGKIEIGAQSNIQDGTIAHATGGFSTVRVGERVTVGHRALLHGCIVDSDCSHWNGGHLTRQLSCSFWVHIGAGSVVTSGTVIPSGVLALGSPAKVIRPLKTQRAFGMDWSWMCGVSEVGKRVQGARMSRNQRPGCFLTIVGILFLWSIF